MFKIVSKGKPQQLITGTKKITASGESQDELELLVVDLKTKKKGAE